MYDCELSEAHQLLFPLKLSYLSMVGTQKLGARASRRSALQHESSDVSSFI